MHSSNSIMYLQFIPLIVSSRHTIQCITSAFINFSAAANVCIFDEKKKHSHTAAYKKNLLISKKKIIKTVLFARTDLNVPLSWWKKNYRRENQPGLTGEKRSRDALWTTIKKNML